MTSAVLDASSLLAYLRDEPGADVVADAIAVGASIGAVNLAEIISRVTDHGADPAELERDMTERRLLGGAVTVESFTRADAVEVGRLRPVTRSAGLSLADRACLALGRRLALPVLTADSAWAGLSLGLDLHQIR